MSLPDPQLKFMLLLLIKFSILQNCLLRFEKSFILEQ